MWAEPLLIEAESALCERALTLHFLATSAGIFLKTLKMFWVWLIKTKAATTYKDWQVEIYYYFVEGFRCATCSRCQGAGLFSMVYTSCWPLLNRTAAACKSSDNYRIRELYQEIYVGWQYWLVSWSSGFQQLLSHKHGKMQTRFTSYIHVLGHRQHHIYYYRFNKSIFL